MTGARGTPKPVTGLRTGEMLGLELACAVLVIAVAIGVLATTIGATVGKARLVEVAIALSGERIAVVEPFAVTGEWGTPAALGGPPSGDRAAAPPPAASTPPPGSIVWAGAPRGDPSASALVLALRPAVVADDASHWAVLWLCGNRATPAGWVSHAPPIDPGVPESRVFAACRRSASP